MIIRPHTQNILAPTVGPSEHIFYTRGDHKEHDEQHCFGRKFKRTTFEPVGDDETCERNEEGDKQNEEKTRGRVGSTTSKEHHDQAGKKV